MTDAEDPGRSAFRAGYRDDEESRSSGGLDHLERARKRIAQLRAQYGDDDDDSVGDAFIDKWFAQAPPGWTYEWKTHSVWNKEYPQYMNNLYRRGWEAVPATRHRDLIYPDYEGDSIIIDGMILMERPKELTDRQRVRDYRKAVAQIINSEQKLAEAPPGTAPRDVNVRTMPRVSSHVGPVVPD
jgi:hypothetical protein